MFFRFLFQKLSTAFGDVRIFRSEEKIGAAQSPVTRRLEPELIPLPFSFKRLDLLKKNSADGRNYRGKCCRRKELGKENLVFGVVHKKRVSNNNNTNYSKSPVMYQSVVLLLFPVAWCC